MRRSRCRASARRRSQRHRNRKWCCHLPQWAADERREVAIRAVGKDDALVALGAARDRVGADGRVDRRAIVGSELDALGLVVAESIAGDVDGSGGGSLHLHLDAVAAARDAVVVNI